MNSYENQICPKCQSVHAYFDISLWICPECAYEWSIEASTDKGVEDVEFIFKDANGVKLENGDTVRVIKDLKVGASSLKSGTKVKGIRLLDEPVNGHDISCRVDGFGSIYLKCSVVLKD